MPTLTTLLNGQVGKHSLGNHIQAFRNTRQHFIWNRAETNKFNLKYTSGAVSTERVLFEVITKKLI